MITTTNYALFVGVDDYSAFDDSLGNKKGTSDLPGGRNDAHAFVQVCRGIGIPDENMRMCVGPLLDPARVGLPASSIGDAGEASILAGLRWLADATGGGRGPGLFTYSGHGDWVEDEGLVLCPSDVCGPNLDHAISFTKIEAIFAKARALLNLTVILDCCFSGGAPVGALRKGGSLTGRTPPASILARAPRLAERELDACKRDGVSSQSRFSGVWRGAFSWAITSALGQWEARRVGSSIEMTIAYEELLDRARRLLASLSFDQEPVLHGTRQVGVLPFLHHGRASDAEETDANPDAVDLHGQLTPDIKYKVTLSGSIQNWTISANGASPPTGTTTNTEYWQMDPAFAPALESAQSAHGTITFDGTQGSGSPVPATGFAMPTDSVWTAMSAAPSVDAFWSSGASPVGLVFNNVTAPSRSNPVWSGTVTWYATGTAPPGSYVFGTGTNTLTWSRAPSAPSGSNWYSMTLPLLTWSSAPGNPNITSSVGGSLASMSGKLYLAYSEQINKHNLMVCSSTDGTSWSTPSDSGADTSFAPSIASMGSTLYMIYNTSPAIHERTSTDGISWSDLIYCGVDTSGAPSLASGDLSDGTSALVMAYPTKTSPPKVASRVSTTGTRWSSTVSGPSVDVSGSPSVGWFGSNFYLAFVPSSSLGQIQIWRSTSVTSSSINWGTAAIATISAVPTAANPSLFAYNGLLFLAFNDDSKNVWLCSSADGTSWSGYENITNKVASVTSSCTPALGVASTGALVLAYVSSRDNNLYTLTTVIPSQS